MTSSDSVSKIISCRFNRPVPDLVNHQYGICRMYSEENPQDFRLPVPCLYPGERVMLLLCAETAFKHSSASTESFRWVCRLHPYLHHCDTMKHPASLHPITMETWKNEIKTEAQS